MKHVLIIGGVSYEPADITEVRDFSDGVAGAVSNDAKVAHTHLDRLTFVIAPGTMQVVNADSGKDLAEYDMVILRSKMRKFSNMSYTISKYCQLKNIKYFNDYSSYYSGTKLLQILLFHKLGLPFLKTVYSQDRQLMLKTIKANLSMPFILKDMYAAHGKSNYLVKDIDQALTIMENEPDADFIAQEYCPNDRDYRILVFGDDELVFERRGSADTHLNNTSTGGVVSEPDKPLPPMIIKGAHAVASKMGLEITGVDVIPNLDTGEMFFLEFNSQPQLFTGAMLDKKLTHFKKYMAENL